MTTQKVPNTAGIGVPQGEPQSSPEELHDDGVRTRENLDSGGSGLGGGTAVWSGAGTAGALACAAAAYLWWRRRTRLSRWDRARRQMDALAAKAGAGARAGAGIARDQAVAQGSRAKAVAGKQAARAAARVRS
ncbi:hypothetical protein ACSNOI_26090 [Actinomadura kijaniata]|uniref:hypothetical protein n=1 Tax=Actinomadura kijaniata TaxID=46161 RepID=UPI003F1CAD05